MFKFDVLELDQNLEVVKTKEKTYLGLGKSLLSNWVRRIKSKNTLDVPKLTSFLNVVDKGTVKVSEGYIGYMLYDSNVPRESATKVSILSSAYSNGQGIVIMKENVGDCFVGFTARKLINRTWLNEKDEFLEPNEENEQFDQFKNDSLVYSLFHSGSNQSSLRQVTYKDKLWDIKNEFFWMSVDEMKKLADDHGYDRLYNDARTSPNRHVYNLLFGEDRIYDKLSPDAKLVLDKASELVRKSIQARQLMSNNENHLDSWDAGYAQLKLVWKEYFSEDFKEFRQMYKNLEDRMRPLVYELGFLIK